MGGNGNGKGHSRMHTSNWDREDVPWLIAVQPSHHTRASIALQQMLAPCVQWN